MIPIYENKESSRQIKCFIKIPEQQRVCDYHFTYNLLYLVDFQYDILYTEFTERFLKIILSELVEKHFKFFLLFSIKTLRVSFSCPFEIGKHPYTTPDRLVQLSTPISREDMKNDRQNPFAVPRAALTAQTTPRILELSTPRAR